MTTQNCEHVCAPLDPQCVKCGADLSEFFEKKYNAFGGYELIRREPAYNVPRLPCGCPLDSGCNGYHATVRS